MSEKKYSLVYIAAIGHSGSTLLDLILGSHKKIESVGEIINISRMAKESGRCTCGESIDSCSYWHAVECLYAGDSFTAFNFVPLPEKNIWRRFISSLRMSSQYPEAYIQEYCTRTDRLMQAISHEARTPYILDSSKDPRRLALLTTMSESSLKVIYLFREGQARVESVKRKAQHKNREHEIYKGAFLETIAFIKSTVYFWYILFRTRKHISLQIIRYKDLTEKPIVTCKQITDWLGIDPLSPNAFSPDAPEHYSKQRNHNIGGNRMRHQKPQQIIYRASWKKGLSFSEKVVFYLLGGGIINTIVLLWTRYRRF